VTTLNGFSCNSASWAGVAANDNGRVITIAGAGTASGLYVGNIASTNSATSFGLAASTPTAQAATTAALYDAFTIDGTHPQPYGSTRLATAITTANFA
jgi:hypothetical protein